MPSRKYLIAIVLTGWALPALWAQENPGNHAKTLQVAVDRVTHPSGTELRGLLYGKTPGGELWFVCRRAWLRAAAPELAVVLEKEQNDREWDLRVALLKRLAAWRKGFPGEGPDSPLGSYIDEQITLMDPGLGEEGPAGKGRFVLIRLPAAQSRRLVSAPFQARKLLLVAWRENVDNAETLSAKELDRLLKKDGIAWDREEVDFQEKMPGMPVESETDWELRQAFMAYNLGPKLRLQGMGDMVLEAGPLGAGGLEKLLGQIGPDIFSKALGDLLGGAPGQPAEGKKGVEQARRVAEGKGLSQFRLTRMQPDTQTLRVVVDDQLQARLPRQGWTVIYRHTINADASIPRPGLEGVIAKDPQVGPLLEKFRQFGLGDKLDMAVRFGAATMAAQEAGEANFQNFLRKAGRRVDGPPLRWFDGPGG